MFEKAAGIVADQRSRNPQLNALFENTEIHPGLPKDAGRQEELLQGKFTVSNVGIKADSRNMRMEISEIKTEAGTPLVVSTMPLEKQLDIIDAPALGLRVLDICGGGRFSFQTLRGMGYEIKVYGSIEKDRQARAIARCHSQKRVTHLEPNDLMKLNTRLADTYTDIIGTPECAPCVFYG